MNSQWVVPTLEMTRDVQSPVCSRLHHQTHKITHVHSAISHVQSAMSHRPCQYWPCSHMLLSCLLADWSVTQKRLISACTTCGITDRTCVVGCSWLEYSLPRGAVSLQTTSQLHATTHDARRPTGYRFPTAHVSLLTFPTKNPRHDFFMLHEKIVVGFSNLPRAPDYRRP